MSIIDTLNFLSYENRTRNPAAPVLFAVFIALQLAVLLACVRYFFRSTWDQHLSSGIWAIVLTCLICNVVICLVEYFFHRYILHIETVRFLRTAPWRCWIRASPASFVNSRPRW